MVLKLKEPAIIQGIDIGNEHSAFVEVFVGNSKVDPIEYREILITSSFMTPQESRESNNPNRVRCFSANALVEDTAKQPWDLVKFVCTQPFNKHVKFGLAFVTLHTPTPELKDSEEEIPLSSESVKKSPEKTTMKFGRFKLKSESEDEDDSTTPGRSGTSVFQKWKENRLSASKEKSDMKSKIQSMKENEKKRKRIQYVNSSDSEEDIKARKPSRNRTSLLYDEEDDLPNEAMEKKLKIAKEMEEKAKATTSKKVSRTPSPVRPRKRSRSPQKATSRRVSRSPSPQSASKKIRHDSPKPKAKSPEKRARKVGYRPFNRLFDGVVFVISGIQNPERADMRSKALEMGAKYKQDWGRGCTHLM